jgi:DNA-binding transcriptional regulator of glucitol operon
VTAEYFWFFLALALAMALQLYYTAQQTKRFMAEVRRLRGSGRVSIGLGGRKWLGRKVYVALAADADGLVVDAILLRGLTHLAKPRPAPRLVGRTTTELASDTAVEGVGTLERQAARQAAETLNASGGWQPTGGAVQGKEDVRPLSSLGQ